MRRLEWCAGALPGWCKFWGRFVFAVFCFRSLRDTLCRTVVGFVFENRVDILLEFRIHIFPQNCLSLQSRRIIIASLLQNWFSMRRLLMVGKGVEHVTGPQSHDIDDIYSLRKVRISKHYVLEKNIIYLRSS